MNEDKGFLQDIIDHPDDDAVRLIYADWLQERGDPRGEFIALQIQRARLAEDDPQREALDDRADRLREEHEHLWIGDVGSFAESWSFERGFVHHVRLTPQAFVENAAA